MSQRVLSTDAAKQSIQKMQQIVTGQLVEQIRALDAEGQRLSQPDVWDGRLAAEFRNDWPNMHRRLNEAKESLDQLRQRIASINQNIMTAGGNE